MGFFCDHCVFMSTATQKLRPPEDAECMNIIDKAAQQAATEYDPTACKVLRKSWKNNVTSYAATKGAQNTGFTVSMLKKWQIALVDSIHVTCTNVIAFVFRTTPVINFKVSGSTEPASDVDVTIEVVDDVLERALKCGIIVIRTIKTFEKLFFHHVIQSLRRKLTSGRTRVWERDDGHPLTLSAVFDINFYLSDFARASKSSDCSDWLKQFTWALVHWKRSVNIGVLTTVAIGDD